MTDEQYRQQYLKKHHINEVFALPIFFNALKASTIPVVQHLLRLGTNGIEFVQLDKTPILKALEIVYQNTAKKEARWEYYNVLKRPEEKGIEFFNPKWQKLITDFLLQFGGLKVTYINDTTREQIRLLLASANELNLSAVDMARYLVKELQSKDFYFNRALRIARTETTTASNFGHLLTEQSLEIQTVKKWVATEDNRTRRSHLLADQQKVNVDEKFTIGGILMNMPGDPQAPAKEIINCRCVLRLVPVYDEMGNPVAKPMHLRVLV